MTAPDALITSQTFGFNHLTSLRSVEDAARRRRITDGLAKRTYVTRPHLRMCRFLRISAICPTLLFCLLSAISLICNLHCTCQKTVLSTHKFQRILILRHCQSHARDCANIENRSSLTIDFGADSFLKKLYDADFLRPIWADSDIVDES